MCTDQKPAIAVMFFHSDISGRLRKRLCFPCAKRAIDHERWRAVIVLQKSVPHNLHLLVVEKTRPMLRFDESSDKISYNKNETNIPKNCVFGSTMAADLGSIQNGRVCVNLSA